jgi:chitodextrinase
MRHRITRALAASALAGLITVAMAVVVAPPAALAQCAVPAWNAGTVYVGGNQVSHNDHGWRAKWWTQGETPGSAAVWEDLGQCEAGGPPAPGECTDPAWNATAVYVGGNRVSHNDHGWRAKWWTQGETPGSAAVWEDLGACDGGGEDPPPPPPPGDGSAAPYLHLGWGSPPSAAGVMNQTGLRAFTMAFMLSRGGCNPGWDGQRPLQGGVDAQVINEIRANGGDIEISFGGWSGNKLGPNCATSQALANAIQQVIDAYDLGTVDMDIENTDEFESEAVQDRILDALRIVKQNNPGIVTMVTIPTTTAGPNFWGTRLINRSAQLGANIDVYNIMTFDFGGHQNMFASATNAATGLNTALQNALGWSQSTAFQHMGITGMVGLSDQQELTSPQIWTQIRDWAQARNMARLSFWSINRDRPCPGGGVASHCSGISQQDFEFGRIAAQFGD